jgi:DNA polymerase-1
MTGSSTGRLISTDPDLQKTPIKDDDGARVRRAFKAPPGRLLISADWSQIELRILAHFSEDPVLVDSFQKNADVHRCTATQLFGVREDEVTPEQRDIAKTVNFATIYGQGALALSQILGISKKEAESFIARYFALYAGVGSWIERTIEAAHRDGSVRTLLGRKRFIPELFSKNPIDAQAGERIAVNTPIQGSAADISRIALLEVSQALTREKLDARLLLLIHDELVLEAPEAEVERTIAIVRDRMERAIPLRVPLLVHVGAGPTWRDAH